MLWKVKNKILTCFIFLAFVQSSVEAQNDSARIFVNPATQNQILGSPVVVKVSVDVLLGCLTAVEIHLDFDNTILQVTSITKPSSADFTVETVPLESIATINSNGRINYAAGRSFGSTCADFDFLEITFTSIAAGTSPLNFTPNGPPGSPPFTRAVLGGTVVTGPPKSNSPVNGQAVITSSGSCFLSNATLSNTATCDGQAFNLIFQSVTYTSGPPSPPYDLVINGTTYVDQTVGSTLITGITTAIQKIWPLDPVTIPNPIEFADLNDNDATNHPGSIEVGVRFQSSVNGFIKGIRFFNGKLNPTGTYTGRLYANGGGAPLASVNFGPVTAIGWYEATFSAPVFITALTTYVATKYSSAGNYSKTNNYFTTGGTTTGSLTALQSGVDGANGVYIYGYQVDPNPPFSPDPPFGPAPAHQGFPVNSFNESNYWVDVMFFRADTTFNITNVIDAAGCTTTGTALTVSSVDCSTLPVSLLNFSATPQGNKITLKWATASEENNRGFDIQRSIDGVNWTTIGFVAGAGNSSFTKNYSYIDGNLAARRYYYKLKQIDFDEHFKYSATVSATLNGKGGYSLGQNYPNPTKGETTIQFTLPKAEKVNLSLFDVSGRIVKVIVNGSKDEGTHAIPVNVGSLTRGIYYYRIQAGDFTDVKKLTIQ
jgi:hypothetical protein